MAAIQQIVRPERLTYEEYLTEGEINRRYDIIDGVREFIPSPNDRHQDILFNIGTAFKEYGKRTGRGTMQIAPRDVLITRLPLRTRQPDVLFISLERRGTTSRSSYEALSPAPELVVEVLSDSDTDKVFMDKLADYCRVNVLECWEVHPETQTVEVLRLSATSVKTEATYRMGETVVSIIFPDLSVPVADIFV